MITKPMLASAITEDQFHTLKFPVYVSIKMDGIRCIKVRGKALSRNFKPIANVHVRETVERHFPDGVDGELMVPGEGFGGVSSAIMSRSGKPDFVYSLFDYVKDSLDKPYIERMEDLRQLELANTIPRNMVKYVQPVLINNIQELLDIEEKFLSEGYEGVMIRKGGKNPYKSGRSSLKEGYLLKLKRFIDSEAEILGFEERMTNNNEADKDALGRTKRSTCKEHMTPAGTLGGFLVRDIHSGVEFSVGSGLNDALRLEIWDNRTAYLGKLIKYKSQPTGVKDLPRFPTFLGFRDRSDM